MTSRNIAIMVMLISAVAVAYLLGKNIALNEELTESQAGQQVLRQSLAATPIATPIPSLTAKPPRTATATPTPRSVKPEESKPVQELSSTRVAAATPKEPAATSSACVIIGNKNSGIYHLPGCPSYSRVAPHNREYFCTEEDAQRAGYRKARNC